TARRRDMAPRVASEHTWPFSVLCPRPPASLPMMPLAGSSMVNDWNSSAAARPARGGRADLVAPEGETGPPTGPIHLAELPTVRKRTVIAEVEDGRGGRWALDTRDTMIDYAPALQRASVLEMIATSPHPVVGAQGQVVPDS